MPPIPLFSALDTPTSSNSSIASYEARCNLVNAEVVLDGIANVRAWITEKGEHKAGWYRREGESSGSRYEYADGRGGKRGKDIEKGVERDKAVARVGLNKSARLVLDIISIAQRAGKYRSQCREIADTAFHLVNAIDAGVQYKVVDLSNVLRDHVERLNQDLEVIIATLKPYASHSWWTRLRSDSKSRSYPQPHRPSTSYPSHHRARSSSNPAAFIPDSDPFDKCLDILDTRTELYSLLISCCLAQAERQAELRARYTELTGGPLRKPTHISAQTKGKENTHRKAVIEGRKKTEIFQENPPGVRVKVRVKEEKARKPQIEETLWTNTSEEIFERHRARSLSESENPNITIRPPTPPRGHGASSKLKRQPRTRTASTPAPTSVPVQTDAHQVRFHTTSTPTPGVGTGAANPRPAPPSHYRTPNTVKPIFPASRPPNHSSHNNHAVSSSVTAPAMGFFRSRSASASVMPTAQVYPRLAPKMGAYGSRYANVSQGRV